MLFGKSRGRRKENPGEAASKREATNIAAEIPSGPGIHELSGTNRPTAPGVTHVPDRVEYGVEGRPIPETPDEVFMIIFLDERREPKVHRLPDEPQARAFVEALLSKGVEREAIETYQASKIDFDITFKPVVRFKGA